MADLGLEQTLGSVGQQNTLEEAERFTKEALDVAERLFTEAQEKLEDLGERRSNKISLGSVYQELVSGLIQVRESIDATIKEAEKTAEAAWDLAESQVEATKAQIMEARGRASWNQNVIEEDPDVY